MRMAGRLRVLEREVRRLRDRERHLQLQVDALRQDGGTASPSKAGGDPRGPVIHVYLVNGQDFYGVVKSMDGESFTIGVSNSAGRVLVIPKRSILYYRMKY